MEASEIYHPATHDRLTEVFFIEPGLGLGLFLQNTTLYNFLGQNQIQRQTNRGPHMQEQDKN